MKFRCPYAVPVRIPLFRTYYGRYYAFITKYYCKYLKKWCKYKGKKCPYCRENHKMLKIEVKKI